MTEDFLWERWCVRVYFAPQVAPNLVEKTRKCLMNRENDVHQKKGSGTGTGNAIPATHFSFNVSSTSTFLLQKKCPMKSWLSLVHDRVTFYAVAVPPIESEDSRRSTSGT